MARRRLYFAHPINTYGTELERDLLARIRQAFPEFEIENPNQPHHQKGYKRWIKSSGRGMNYFLQEVIPQCDAGVFLPFRDGSVGRGVFDEIKCLAERGCDIWTINHKRDICKVDDVDSSVVLTVEETRARIRTKGGETIPY